LQISEFLFLFLFFKKTEAEAEAEAEAKANAEGEGEGERKSRKSTSCTTGHWSDFNHQGTYYLPRQIQVFESKFQVSFFLFL